MKFSDLKGYLLAALAAAAYGTNPAFAIPLYDQGMNPNTVLLFRYMMGIPLLALVMFARNIPFRLNREETGQTAILGILMALSSLTLFESYKYMNSGIASTLLFVYPIMVAVMMIFFFHEKFRFTVALCLLIMCCGLYPAYEAAARPDSQCIRLSAGNDVRPHLCALHHLCQCIQNSQEHSHNQTSVLRSQLGMRDVYGNDTAGQPADSAGR